QLLKPAADLPPPALRPRPPPTGERTAIYGYPKVGLDGKGHGWLSSRQKIATRFGVQPGTSWITAVRRPMGEHWSEPIDLHHSDGLLDSRPAMLPHAGGGLLVVHNTDERYAKPGPPDNQIY